MIKIILLFCIFSSILAQKAPFWGGNPRFTVKVAMLGDEPK